MKSKFRPTSPGLSCPICGDTTGDCRILTDGNVLCHTAAYESGLETNGYKFIKTCGPAPWGYFVQNEAYRLDGVRLEALIKPRKRDKDKREKRQLKEALSSQDFDSIFRRLHGPTGLDQDHLEDLIKRGLKQEDIERLGFFSLEKDQATVVGVPWKFPGVYNNTFSLRGRGYVVPAFTREGLIHGYQIRCDVGEGAKYVWPKTTLSSHVVVNKELELPLTYVDFHNRGGDVVLLVEGLLKAIIASYITGYPVIGAAGGAFASSKHQLKLMLADFKEIWLCPDGGDAINVNVYNRMIGQINKISSIQSNVKVKWWGQVTKADGDIDEIAGEVFESAKLLTPSEFIKLCNNEQRKHLLAKEQEALRGLSIEPLVTIDERYLPDLQTLIPQFKGIVALKSPKNTGKSYQINNLTTDAKLKGRKILTITPRIALGREQAIKWKVQWIGDIEGKTTSLKWENLTDLGLCWDSLWKLGQSKWSDTVIIIDEAELAVGHFLLSSTCRERRAQILSTLQTLIPECLKQGGCLLVADADLTDVSLGYFSSLAPDAEINLIVNKGTEVPKWDVTFWEGGSKDTIIEQIFERLATPITDETGSRQRRIAVAVDSQAEAEALERAVLDHDPTIKVIRIDRKTTETDFGKAFMEAPNEGIKDQQPVLFIFTPSMGAGVSIDCIWFDEMYGLYFGTIVPSQSRQMLGRIRDPIPRYVWCKKTGIIKDGQSVTRGFIRSNEVKDHLFQFNQNTGVLIDVARVVAGERCDEDKHIMESLVKSLWDDIGATWDNVHLECYAKIVARNNFDKQHLSQTLIRELKEEGHRVTVVGKGSKNGTGEKVREVKKKLPVEEAAAIVAAKTITFEEAQMLEGKTTTSEEERFQITKAYLMNEFPGLELTPELVHKAVTKNHRRWLNAHKLWWYAIHPKDTRERDLAIWKTNLKNFAEGVAYLPDIKTLSLQIRALIDIGLIAFVKEYMNEPERTFTKDSPEILAILSKARGSSRLKSAYGMRITKKSQGIKSLNNLLEKVGMKLRFYKEGKGKVRMYQLDQSLINDPDRLAVLESLELKKQQREEAKALLEENAALEVIFGERKATPKKEREYKNPLDRVASILIENMTEVSHLPSRLRALLKKATTLVTQGTVLPIQLWDSIPHTLKVAAKATCKKEFKAFSDAIISSCGTSEKLDLVPF